jgi:hypothetical protein
MYINIKVGIGTHSQEGQGKLEPCPAIAWMTIYLLSKVHVFQTKHTLTPGQLWHIGKCQIIYLFLNVNFGIWVFYFELFWQGRFI